MSFGSVPSISLARALPCSTESLPTMAPMDLLVTQLQCDSSEARVDAMRRLKTVADAIGTESTLAQLLPFLASNVAMDDEEEDEILLTLAAQLAGLVPRLVPGYRALPILPILERLAAVEETVVRDKAVESIQRIVPVLLDGDSSSGDGSNSGSGSGSSSNDDGRSEGVQAAASAAPALLLAMAKRLSGADWFTAKVSAAGILPVVYGFYNNPRVARSAAAGSGDQMNSPEEARRELRLLYKDLSEDDTPMVKRSAAKHLGPFVEAVANLGNGGTGGSNGGAGVGKKGSASGNGGGGGVPENVKSVIVKEMIPIFQTLANDEQDSVRLLAVCAAGSMGRALNMDADKNSSLVWPVVRNGGSDLSWRVRNNLAKEFATVAAAMGFASNTQRQNEVFQCFASLLQDAEAEVRAAAVTNIARMTSLGGAELFLSHIAPTLPSLGDDPVMEVRSRLARTLMDCCDDRVACRLSDKIILSTIRPHVETFLTDEFAEVQLHILTRLSRISNLLSKMDAVVHSVLQMSKDKNWRVREAVSRLLPHLADAMGVPFFEEHLLTPWLKLLFDRVADVRTGCVRGMPKLLDVAGADWIGNELLPQYARLYDESPSYLNRITIVECHAALCGGAEANRKRKTNVVVAANDDRNGGGSSLFSNDDDDSDDDGEPPVPKVVDPRLSETVVAFMLKGLNDRVANVRMVSARGIERIVERCEESVRAGMIEPALRERSEGGDEDEDCKYFIQKALDACS